MRSITTAVLTFALAYVEMNFVGIVTITSLFTIINIVLCLLLDKMITEKKENDDVRGKSLVESNISQISDMYSLTEKEKEVLVMLLTTEDTNQEMADKLYYFGSALQDQR